MMYPRSMKALLACVSICVAGMTSTIAHGAEQLNARFSWKLKGEYGAMYLAEGKGYYADKGLSVRFGEGAGSQAALGALLQGQDDVVILPGIFALTAINKGMPIKLIALYNPKASTILISHPDKPVRTPKDLEGKTVAVAIGETATEYLDVFCQINQFDCQKMKRVQISIQARIGQFLAREVDVAGVQATNDLPLLEQKGVNLVQMDLTKFGLSLPGLAVVSSDAIIAKKPDALRGFLSATGRAIQEASKDPSEAAKALAKAWPGAPAQSILMSQIKATMDGVPQGDGKPIGWIDEKAVSEGLNVLKLARQIDSNKPLSTYFTNSLLAPAAR